MQALQEIQIENNSELGAVVSSRVVANELEKTRQCKTRFRTNFNVLKCECINYP